MTKTSEHFGTYLRELRLAKGISLRKFAEEVGISPNYLSQVEKGNIDPPTADRVARIAELLEQNPDELIGLAGRIPLDLPEIIQANPCEMSELIRATKGLSSEQLRNITKRIRKLKKSNDNIAP